MVIKKCKLVVDYVSFNLSLLQTKFYGCVDIQILSRQSWN